MFPENLPEFWRGYWNPSRTLPSTALAFYKLIINEMLIFKNVYVMSGTNVAKNTNNFNASNVLTEYNGDVGSFRWTSMSCFDSTKPFRMIFWSKLASAGLQNWEKIKRIFEKRREYYPKHRHIARTWQHRRILLTPDHQSVVDCPLTSAPNWLPENMTNLYTLFATHCETTHTQNKIPSNRKDTHQFSNILLGFSRRPRCALFGHFICVVVILFKTRKMCWWCGFADFVWENVLAARTTRWFTLIARTDGSKY